MSDNEKIGKLTFDCSMCSVQCKDQKALAAHLDGKQHQKKLKLAQGTKLHCNVCDLETTNQEVLDQHLAGKKHQKNVAKLGNVGKDPVLETNEKVKTDKSETFDCFICQVKCQCQKTFDAHLDGKKHKKKMEMSKQNKPQGDSCNIEATSQAGKNHQKKAATFENTEMKLKIFQKVETDTSESVCSQFRCTICDVETSDQDEHLAGENHQKKLEDMLGYEI